MRFQQLWERVRDSLWFVPSLLTLTAALASYATIAFDRAIVEDSSVRELWFVFSVGAEGARATLSAIAQSVITVTGVVFSVTIVALQLAASQFTPRVLRTYLADRGNQWVLGIFIGTFTYTILVERTVGSAPGEDEAFVPSISVTVAVALMLVSIGALIYFINHIAQSIRASVIVTSVARDGRKLVDSLFPEMIGDAVADRVTQDRPPAPHGEPIVLRATEAGYLQAVDERTILSVAREGRAVIRMEPHVGHFVLPGEPLATIWFDEGASADGNFPEIERKVRRSLILGSEWTLQQDLERALVELSDIAVRALSPSLNDPTTATLCVDRLGEILTLLGSRRFPATTRTDDLGKVRFITRSLSWERAVGVAFEKIRHHGARSPSVLIRMIEVLGRTARVIPPDRSPPLEKMIREGLADGERGLESEPDLARLRHAVAIALRETAVTTGEVGPGAY
jgi:uncharacterized membrane protein